MEKYYVICERDPEIFEAKLNKLYSQGYVLHTAHPSSNEDGIDYFIAIMELPNSGASK